MKLISTSMCAIASSKELVVLADGFSLWGRCVWVSVDAVSVSVVGAADTISNRMERI